MTTQILFAMLLPQNLLGRKPFLQLLSVLGRTGHLDLLIWVMVTLGKQVKQLVK